MNFTLSCRYIHIATFTCTGHRSSLLHCPLIVQQTFALKNAFLTWQAHHEVNAATSSDSTPVCTNALTLCHSLAYDIETSTHPETSELFDLLTSPHIDVSTTHSFILPPACGWRRVLLLDTLLKYIHTPPPSPSLPLSLSPTYDTVTNVNS